MTSLAVMQPYFFPYIGYFQLVNAVDTFVFLDDVQYIDRGWVNRNKIRVGDKSKWLTMPVWKASRKLTIRERAYVTDPEITRSLIRRIDAAYRGFPYYDEIFPLVTELLESGISNVADFNACLVERIARGLGIQCQFELSSAIPKSDDLAGQELILEICRRLGASKYVNAEGGRQLYERSVFAGNGLRLFFLKTKANPVALQSGDEHLSIIDTLMTYGFDGVSGMLSEYAISVN